MDSSSIFNNFQGTLSDKITINRKDFELVQDHLRKVLELLEGFAKNDEINVDEVIQDLDGTPQEFIEDPPNVIIESEFEIKQEKVSMEIEQKPAQIESSDAVVEVPKSVDENAIESPQIEAEVPRDKIKCQECHKFISKKAIHVHRSDHRNRKLGRVFKCQHCSYMTYMKRNFLVHVRKVHKVEVLSSSVKPTEMKVFNQWKWIGARKSTKNGTNSTSNDVNQVTVPTPAAQNPQKCIVKPLKLKCPECRKFIPKKDLRAHKNLHKNKTHEFPFTCQHCKRPFVHKKNFMRHLRETHKLQVSSASVNPEFPMVPNDE